MGRYTDMTDFLIRDQNGRAKALQALRQLDITKPWQFTLKRYYPRRTLSQNARLHKLLHLIADETGNDLEDVKTAFKEMFLEPVNITIGKRQFMVRGSTAKQDTAQLSKFMDKIEAYAARELGVQLGE